MLIKTMQQITKLPQDFVRILIVFILNIFLSLFFPCISNPKLRIIYSYIGILFVYIMAQDWLIFFLSSTIICYFLLKIIKFQNKLILSIFVSIPFLLVIHLQRFIFTHEVWKVGIQGPQMIVTTRIIYYGLYLNKKQKKTQQNGIFQYLGYILFFPGVIIGPSFSFQTYLKFVNLQKQYAEIKYPLKSVFYLILQGFILVFLTSLTNSAFPIDWAYKNQYYLNSNIFIKLLLFTLVGFTYRIKYYTGWTFIQVAINISGINYSQKQTYDQVLCGSIMVQIQPNPRLKTQYWNTSVQRWLKECIYEPTLQHYSKKSSLPTFLTFFSSAIWHGFHLTYYITFIQWGFMINSGKLFYRNYQKFKFLEKIPGIRYFSIILLNFIMSYIVMAAVVLDLDKAIHIYRSLYWFGSIFILLSFIFLSILKPKPKSIEKKTQ